MQLFAASRPSLSRTAGPKQHLLQLYRSDAFLADSVADFVSAGLLQGEAGVIIATREHREVFSFSLKQRSIDVATALASGQLVMLDAAETLASFSPSGVPVRELFFSRMGKLFETFQVKERRFSSVRAYGEMVSLLWDKGDEASTIVLEQFWNELATKYSFSLLCGYPKTSFDRSGHREALLGICQAHSHTLPGEQA